MVEMQRVNSELIDEQYVFEHAVYTVIDFRDTHFRLKNDEDFFNEYFKEKLHPAEVIEVKSEEIPEQNDTTDKTLCENMFKWNRTTTKLLLKEYLSRKWRFRDPTIKKKILWAEIEKEFLRHGHQDVTDDMLNRKMRNLKQSYRQVKQNNIKSTNKRGRISWEWYETFEEIFSDDKTINFGPTISSMDSITEQSERHSPAVFISSSQPSTSKCQLKSPGLICNIASPNATETSLEEKELLEDLASRSTMGRTGATDEELSCSTPLSNYSKTKVKKRRKMKELYGLRKKQLEIEEERIKAIHHLRDAIQEHNRIQQENNEINRRKMKMQAERNKILLKVLNARIHNSK